MSRRRQLCQVVGLALSTLCILVFAPGPLQQVSAQVGGTFDLTWRTIAGGSTSPSTGGVYSVSGTVGQPAVGTVSGGPFSVGGGFWSVVGSSPPPDAVGPTLSIDDVTVTEGSSGTTNAVFTVALSAASTQQVTVRVQTTDGSAVSGSDFTGLPLSTLTFNPGVAQQSLTVSVLGDTVAEGVENFAVNLSNPTNASIADGQGVGTILDDDGVTGALPTLSIGDVRQPEGSAGVGNAVFTVTLSRPSTVAVTVVAQTATGSATAGSDYLPIGPITLTFNPGLVTRTVAVPILGDTVAEADESYVVRLSAPTGATIADADGLGTIVDDDVVAATVQNHPGDDDTEDAPRESEERRHRRSRTNASSVDDERTQGNVVEIRPNAEPPVVVIANTDGLVELRLTGEARDALEELAVGQYVTAAGYKEHEGLYYVDELSIE